MDERRTKTRRRVLKAATIEFGGAAFSCTLRNVSDTGAALEVTSPIGIPEQFTLVIPAARDALALSGGLAKRETHRRDIRIVAIWAAETTQSPLGP